MEPSSEETITPLKPVIIVATSQPDSYHDRENDNVMYDLSTRRTFSPRSPSPDRSGHSKSLGLSLGKRWGDMFKGRGIFKLFSDSKVDSETKEEVQGDIMTSLLQETHTSPMEIRIELAIQDETDEFHKEVCRKSSENNMSRTEAVIDVYTDRYVAASESLNSALINILSSPFSKDTINIFVKALLARGASSLALDHDMNTPLHLVAKNGSIEIAKKLVEVLSLVYAKNKDGDTPFEVAIFHKQDAVAAYIGEAMPAYEVRRIFTAVGHEPSRLSFHTMLEHAGEFSETIHIVLDSMKVLDQMTENTYHLHYGILEADRKGFQPGQANFNRHQKSCLHIIARSGYEEIVYHETVRLLLRYKWKKFGRVRFLVQCLSFLIHMLVMSIAFILAAREDNAKHYFYPSVTGANIIRLLCEVIYLIFTFWNLASEIFQMFRHKLKYLQDWYNYLDLLAIVFSLLIIPLRFSQNAQAENAQWLFASIAYLLNVMRGYKFAVVLRTTGAYVEIISSILRYDIVPFSIIFAMFLFAFSGATYLALKFEGVVDAARTPHIYCPSGNSTNSISRTRCQDQTYLLSEWWFVLFNGFRVMVESGSVFDNYYQPCSTCGFGWLSLLLHVTFLFFVIVVFLNLIIAQMSDTYQNVWSDAQRKLYKNRAWILARIEHNSLFAICMKDFRTKHFKPLEVIKNPKNILDKWEVPPLNSLGKNVEKLRADTLHNSEVLEEIKTLLMGHRELIIQVIKNQAAEMDNVEVPKVKQRSRVINQLTEANKVSEGIVQMRNFLNMQ
ncbi:hypothetical protein LOD99_1219 [Oopsacas minuta]|uniref:Ion transport domain-containing protein n=1 Tax=Oopsacas minuta TaxID=111878 RepID=A0AAV7K6S5_9METZ|nr:hypothetical protein LOD99_1219 [Oopsacas minuta]